MQLLAVTKWRSKVQFTSWCITHQMYTIINIDNCVEHLVTGADKMPGANKIALIRVCYFLCFQDRSGLGRQERLPTQQWTISRYL